MDWVLDHLQLIIGAAGAIAYWLTQRKRGQAGGDEQVPRETQFEDPELAERTRRIREEIQKKIEQRRRGGEGYERPVQSAPLQEPPALGDIEQSTPAQTDLPPPLVREVIIRPAQAVAAADAAASRRMAELLEEQAALAEKLKQAQEMKAAALRRQKFEAAVSEEKTVQLAKRALLVEELRQPESIRRAMILREILGPPVALRS